MKISFLVTYYNQKDFVQQSMDSILAIEKPCDWEILVGDDGSNDGTTDVVKQYMAQYPENIFLYVMDREPNKKYETVRRASANRINLLDHMTGDYFCVLDGDDLFCNCGFAAEALALYQAHPETAVVAFGYETFTDSTGVLERHHLPAGPIDTKTYLSTGMFTHGGACVMKSFMSADYRQFLHRLGYYDDNNIITANLAFGTMYASETIIYAYRQSENSTIHSMNYAEVAVLNAQSYDVDVQLLPTEADALLLRYSTAILNTYFLRHRLPKLLGQDKYSIYLHGCSQLKNSLSYLLLSNTTGSKAAKKQIADTVGKLIKLHPKFALRLFLTSLRHR